MLRLLLALVCWCAPSLALASLDFPYEPDADLYVRVKTSSSASVAVAFTEGTSNAVGFYTIADGDLSELGSSRGVFFGKVLYGSTPSTSAADAHVGNVVIYWNGSACVTPEVYLMGETTSDAGASTFGRAWHNLRQAFAASTTGVYGTPSLVNAPTGEGGGVVLPINQVVVPESRTWKLVRKPEGLLQEKKRTLAIGESHPFAIDFINDLATNGRLVDFDAFEIEDGTAGGVTFDDVDGLYVDKTQAKIELTAVTEGTYVLKGTVEYDDSDGGGTSIFRVTLVVVE